MSLVKIGYCRVSTIEQNAESQMKMLREAGCEEIFEEKVSGGCADRAELKKLLDYIRKGDVVVVTKLDRLARSTKDLISISEHIAKKNAELEILNINLETKTPTGRLMMTMLGAFAEFEREMMLERQREGISIAKSKGLYKGRKPVDAAKFKQIQALVATGMSVNKAAVQVGISRRTYYNAVAQGKI